MNACVRCLMFALLAVAALAWTSGCSDKTKETKAPAVKGDKLVEARKEGDHKDHKQDGDNKKDGDHKDHKKDADHKDHKKDGHKDDHDHDKPLTEKDVKMPDSFKAGVARLDELHKKIHHLIEDNQLGKVHRVAEEMALVANGTKRLAAKDLPEDKQTEAGRFCNEVASSYRTIDEAADAGKKAETEAIHKKMGAAVENLKKLTK